MKKKLNKKSGEIKFFLKEQQIEIIKISKDGFYYKGKRVDDVHNVYERFNKWLSEAEIK